MYSGIFRFRGLVKQSNIIYICKRVPDPEGAAEKCSRRVTAGVGRVYTVVDGFGYVRVDGFGQV